MLDTRVQGLGSMLERFARSLALRERESARACAANRVPILRGRPRNQNPESPNHARPIKCYPQVVVGAFWSLFDAILWAFIAKS